MNGRPSSRKEVQRDSGDTSYSEGRTTNQERRSTRNRISTKDTKYKDFVM